MLNKNSVSYKIDSDLVSIIIPTYNRSYILKSTLDSLLNIIYRPLEIVIVDDGSIDNTESMVSDWIYGLSEESDICVKYFKQENCGAPSARNLGIKKSNGKYIQFLDSDDFLNPDKISVQIEALKKNDFDIAVCDFRLVSTDDNRIENVRNDGNLLRKMTLGGSISCFTPLIKAELIKNRIEWDTRLSKFQDMDFLLKVLIVARNYIYTPGYLCDYYQHNGKRISDNYKQGSSECFKRIKGLLKFAISNIRYIPKKNFKYLIVAFFTLSYFPIKKIRKKIFKKIRKYISEYR